MIGEIGNISLKLVDSWVHTDLIGLKISEKIDQILVTFIWISTLYNLISKEVKLGIFDT